MFKRIQQDIDEICGKIGDYDNKNIGTFLRLINGLKDISADNSKTIKTIHKKSESLE